MNSYSRILIAVCKESGLRIVNGHFTSDLKGNFTFQNRQGTSLIDIAAVHVSCLDVVKDFRVGQFTHISDHAPIFLSLCIHTSIIYSEKHCTCSKTNVRYSKWDNKCAQQTYQSITENENVLYRCVSESDDVNKMTE